MKYLPFVLKHLRRNWVRTSSTVVAMAVCIFLLCTLRSVLAEVDGMLAASQANRLVTRHAVSLTFALPMAYEARLQSIPGVKRVAKTAWFGGSLPAKKEGTADGTGDAEASTTDWSNFFNNMAVDVETYFAMYPEMVIPPDQWKAFLETRSGCVIGSKLAKKFNWKVGDKFFLESFIPPYRRRSGPFEFVVTGIYDADLTKYPGTDVNSMFFHYEYLKEGVAPRDVGVGTFAVEIENGDDAGKMTKAIDALFENSSAATLTETEQAFKAGFIAMAGNLALLLNGIGLAVAFTILLVTANTMSMAVRERRTEIGVLKTLGFSSAHVMGFVVGEALVLGVLGGALGVFGSQGLLYGVSHSPGVSDILAGIGLSGLELKPDVALLGFFVAVILGLFAGLVPALSAYRAKITDILRTV
ncbi:MAG: FtsX-like permease family protein [Vicinamibacteria bacterium]|nr:FtsX-like permease family protein [Vicinamibacteria bacterium]MBP9945233.1 FtsX-like permease family protein [Vicinamibacteria bacterium]